MYSTLGNGLLGDYVLSLMNDGKNPLFMLFAFAPVVIIFLTIMHANNKSTIVTVGALLIAIFGANLILAHLILTSIILLYAYKTC